MNGASNDFVKHPEPSNNRLSIALAAVLGMAVGVAVGLAIASIGGISLVDPRQQNPTFEKGDVGVAELHDLSTNPQPNWEGWTKIVQLYGPGTAYSRFLERLQSSGHWDPWSYWSLQGNFGMIELSSITAYLGDSSLQIGNMIIADDSAGSGKLKQLWPTFYFDQNKLIFLLAAEKTPGVTRAALVATIKVIGEATGLSPDALRRLGTMSALIPIVFPNHSEQAMSVIVAKLPAHVQSRFEKICSRTDDDEVHTLGVEFSLDEQWIACLAFDPAEPAKWSIHISGAWEEPLLPRLTVAEVDALPNP